MNSSIVRILFVAVERATTTVGKVGDKEVEILRVDVQRVSAMVGGANGNSEIRNDKLRLNRLINVANNRGVELAIRKAADEVTNGLAGTLSSQCVHPATMAPVLENGADSEPDYDSDGDNQNGLTHGIVLSRLSFTGRG